MPRVFSCLTPENLAGGEERLKKTKEEVSERENKLLNLIRQTSFGEVKIIIQDGEPIRVEEVKKSIKL